MRIAHGWAVSSTGPVLLALDAPLGRPLPLAETLPAHRAGEELGSRANALFRRATDDFIRRQLGKRPLDVAADRIARTAEAALRLLGELRRALGVAIPLLWEPAFTGFGAIEVYPAATLRAHGVAIRGKSGTPERLERLLEELGSRACLPADSGPWERSHDALDAAICVLAAHDFLRGRAMAPPGPALAERARTEGWIWVRNPGDRP